MAVVDRPTALSYSSSCWYGWEMTKIEDIEKAVEHLSSEDLAKFRQWFEEFDARVFDGKIARDAKSGKLDELLAEARVNHKAGRRKDL
jgi:hypothetical protein